MKKKFPYNEMSATRACNCGQKIKRRLEDRNLPICYKCWCIMQKVKGHIMRDALPKINQFPTAKRATTI